jgi:hypothetical protein
MKLLKSILPLFAILFVGNIAFSQAQVYTQNTSSPAACDGVAWIDSTFTASSTVWMGGGAVIQQGGLYVYNLCPGTYIVSANSMLGGSVNLTFTIGSGNTNPCAGFTLSVSSTDATNTSSCDGSATAFVSGGTSPYAYTWGQGSTTSAINNLCLGTYQICVTDANGCITCDNVTIADASAMDSVLVFNNTPFPGGVVTGVLAADSIEDCNLNYQNVASASVTNSTVIGTDSLLVTWTLVDSTGLTVASYNVVYTIPNAANGIYGLTLVVFCSQKAMNYNTIVINDQVMLGSNGIEVLMENDVVVVNPFENQLEVYMPFASSGTLTLLNMVGQELQVVPFNESAKITLNTVNVPSGSYLILISNDKGQVIKSVIKN